MLVPHNVNARDIIAGPRDLTCRTYDDIERRTRSLRALRVRNGR